MDNGKRYGAEFLGTLLLVFFGVGSAIAARVEGGVVVVALAFGLTLLALVYALGPVSGSHVNPAVTLGALVSGRLAFRDAVGYWIAQALGATVAAFLLRALVEWGGVEDQTGVLGTNGYGENISAGGTMLLETVLTFLLVLVVLVTTGRTENTGLAAVLIGMTIAACHLVGVALDGTSVNPARSLGPALFEGGAALSQLWVFILFPLFGGLLAALALPLIGLNSAHPGSAHPGQETPPPAG